MDKNEYSIRLEEIKTLIAKQKYAEAAAIADTIDWRRVKKVITLCTISDLYKINRRLEDARDVLLLAYDRHPGGRFIVYSLCELSIKMGSFVEAVEYYKEFVQIAPRDSGRYVLQYKLYEAQEVSLEERIEVLEELKSKDYSEKWAYELAYLYHRIGLGTKCVEECDELILWFGEGKYVQKAMELKQLHAPLTNEQQVKYYQLQGMDVPEEYYPENEVQETVQNEMDWLEAPTKEIPQQELDIQVKLMNVGQYDTINIQKELAQNMKELLGEAPEKVLQEEAVQDEPVQEEPVQEELVQEVPAQEEPIQEAPEPFLPEEAVKYEAAANEPEMTEETGAAEEKPTKFDKILGMEYDGQISMLVPDFEKVEKQITGQLRLDEVLVEWEKIKKNSEQKRMEAVRQHVMEQTGAMFTEFEEAARDGLLEQLESEDGISAEETLQEEEAVVEELDAGMEEAAEEEPDAGTEEAAAEEPGAGVEEAVTEEPDAGMEEALESEDLAAGEMLALFDELAKMVEEGGEYENEAIEEVGGYEEEIAEETDTYEEETDSGADDDNYEETTEYEEVTEESGEYENGVSEPEEDIESGSGAEETGDETGEEAKEDTKDQQETSKREGSKVRAMSPEERQHFGHYLQSKATKEQIVYAIDNISMAAYTGNVIITGEEGMDTMTLAKNLIKEVQQTDSNFSGKIAKISGEVLNKKKVGATFKKLVNGALIIQNAGALKKETAEQIRNALEQEHSGIIVVLEDLRKSMDKLLKRSPALLECFNIRIDIEALDNDSLVAIGKKYAKDKEYSIDELGVLALHTCIAERQTSDHAVTVAEVREIMEGAIRHANKKTLGHFFEILLAKRYDEEDMIILREKDFNNISV
ncbi:MAG: hypothetical protein K2I22_08740 [Lachnospiraceae bacterium]|nr:hypothetical protein [Lachnospiraceae bacterium]